jgi:drug/metabolite transporter (DMT)-like permease
VLLAGRDAATLALLTLLWGVNWPVMKFGVEAFPPLSFRWISMIGGVLTLAIWIRLRHVRFQVPRGQLWRVLGLAVPNMVVWHLCAIYGVKFLSSGRAAILGYTMPVWALMISVLVFRERAGRGQWLGVGCALAGTALLLSSEWAALSGRPLGVLLMLTAAAGWGLGTVLVRRWPVDTPTTTLTFWMLVITLLPTGIGALLIEAAEWRPPNAGEWLAIAYNAVVVFGFCHLAWFHLARLLPPVASGLSVMLIPVVGVYSGMWALGEIPRWQDYAALVLVLCSLATVLLRRPET